MGMAEVWHAPPTVSAYVRGHGEAAWVRGAKVVAAASRDRFARYRLAIVRAPVAFRRHLAMGLLTTNRLATVASLHPRSAATRAASFGISSSPACSSASRSTVAAAEP